MSFLSLIGIAWSVLNLVAILMIWKYTSATVMELRQANSSLKEMVASLQTRR